MRILYSMSQIISYVFFFTNLELPSSKPFFLLCWQEVDLIVTKLEFLNLRTHIWPIEIKNELLVVGRPHGWLGQAGVRTMLTLFVCLC